MDKDERLDKIQKWFDSEEGKKSVAETLEEMEKEEAKSKRIEDNSILVYRDGQKVKRGDIYIDLDSKEMENLEPSPWGHHRYVYRINEDGTIDFCLGCSITAKMNGHKFESQRAVLVERNGELHNPLNDLFESMEN